MDLKATSADIENWSCNASQNTDSSVLFKQTHEAAKSENLYNSIYPLCLLRQRERLKTRTNYNRTRVPFQIVFIF